MKALVTGFDPFDGEAVNPSFAAISRLPPRIDALDIAVRRLPTAFGLSLTALEGAIDETRPDIVLCVGQAGGRSALSLERVAINLDDARIPDNDGAQPIDRPVVAGGPAAYFTTLPIKAIIAALRAEGLPAIVSQTAGTFVCNHVFYGLMHLAKIRGAAFGPPLRGGFLHVPYLPSQAVHHPSAPSMALEQIARGIEIALSVAASRETDVTAAEGSLD